ncbi:MAG TPA: alr0857 family protein [Coleofasciculaceae cyanobacterium]
MLKITFMETGSHLEQLTQSLEEWIGLRVLLALRAAQRLVVESSTATILLRSDLADLALLEEWIEHDPEDAIALCRSDVDYMEVSLRGTWVTSHAVEAEGVFVALIHPDLEALLLELWQKSQNCPSSIWR